MRMRFGIFLAPFHPPGQNPTLAIERDLELVVRLDELGYDEAWIGEHHSAGFELIASPEVFIAVAAERTRHIRLGTGVSSLPYHHPLMLTDRMVLLDHLTRGRTMLGVGPGSLPTDAVMMGIDPLVQRPRMEEALEAILALLQADGDERISRTTDWFTLDEARLQLRPFTDPCFEIAVAATVSPSGPRLAGRFGLGMLSLSATVLSGYDQLAHHADVAAQLAEQHGRTFDRSGWRLVGPMHLAETEEQARLDVHHGILEWVDYFRNVAALPLFVEGDKVEEIIDNMISSGLAVIGTPEQAIAQIERLQQRAGDFGAFLFMSHEWADREATLHSYELFAREVMPRFQGSSVSTTAARDWARDHRPALVDKTTTAVLTAVAEHAAANQPN